jgi:hypothetical protein
MRKFFIPLMLLIILLPAIGRLILHRFDATFFIVADSHFVKPERLPYPITLAGDEGYDGQFYFKTALDLSIPTEDGIRYDEEMYRKQRILYPLLAWLAAFGSARMIPPALIAVNCLSLILIWGIFYRLCKDKDLPVFFSVLPVMYTGLQMSVGRDLAEPVETLIVLSLLYFGTSNPLTFSALATLALLTKETTIVFILPIAALMVFHFVQQKTKIWDYILIALPFGVMLAWKSSLETSPAVHGTGNLAFPFTGMIAGFARYFEVITLKNIVSFGLAGFSLAWIVWLVVMVSPHIKAAWHQRFKERYAEIAWLAWLFFSLLFSVVIYEDDWSFVRLFSAFTGISFLILYSNQDRPGKWFIWFSVFMFAVITARLWLRV